MKNIVICFFLAILIFSTASAQQSRNALPEIGVVASDAISIDKELQIGDVLMMQMRGQAPIVYDPVLEEYLNDLGNRLVAQADNVKFPFSFFWIKNSEINAFAFFGGHVGVHTGLINYADTESELASVLAHEVSHVTQRHIARRIAAQKKASPLQIASMLGGILLAMADPEAGFAAISVGNAASQQFSINYTRSNEQEADRVAFRMMDLAGFETAGASAFFGKLVEKHRVQSKPPAFLLTHPLPESRVADARARENLYQRKQLPPSLPFHLVKARIQSRYTYDAKYNIAHYQSLIDKKTYVLKEAAMYGLAIAYYENEEVDKAHETLQPLLQKDPENLFYVDLATDIAISQDRAALAVSNLSKLDKKIPKNQVISLNLANAAIKAGDYDKAIAVLKDYLLVNPDHMLSYQLLTDAYGGKKAFLQMHQAKAEWLALYAAYPNAIDELQTAYNYTGDSNIEKQRIRARIEQLRTEQKRLETL
ncbi:MAG: M48 family metalloprotease [Aestuariibacter sp.]